MKGIWTIPVLLCLGLVMVWTAGPAMAEEKVIRSSLTQKVENIPSWVKFDENKPAMVEGREVRSSLTKKIGDIPSWVKFDEDEPALSEEDIREKNHQADLILGTVWMRQGYNRRAAEYFQKMLKNNPVDVEVLGSYTEALLEEGQPDLAWAEVLNLQALAPDDFRTQYLTARCHLAHEDMVEALSILDQMIKEYPDNSGIMADAGNAAQILGFWWEAVKYYEMTLTLEPNQPVVRQALKRLLQDHRPKLATMLAYERRADKTDAFMYTNSFRTYLNHRFRLDLDWEGETMHRPADEFNPSASSSWDGFSVGFDYQAGNFMHLGLSGGIKRLGLDQFFGSAHVGWEDSRRGKIMTTLDINDRWSDPILAAESEGSRDRAALQAEWRAPRPWLVLAEFAFNKYYLNHREDEYADTIEYRAGWGRILRDQGPFLMMTTGVGGSERFNTAVDDANLLLPREFFPFLSYYLENDFSERSQIISSGGLRYDTLRQLFGWDAGLAWRYEICPRIIAETGYHYNSESQTVDSGDSHRLHFGLEYIF